MPLIECAKTIQYLLYFHTLLYEYAHHQDPLWVSSHPNAAIRVRNALQSDKCQQCSQFLWISPLLFHWIQSSKGTKETNGVTLYLFIRRNPLIFKKIKLASSKILQTQDRAIHPLRCQQNGVLVLPSVMTSLPKCCVSPILAFSKALNLRKPRLVQCVSGW